MGTRSRVGMEFEDGTIRSFYCHWDGYVELGVGEALLRGYSDPDKLRALVDLGDRSSISATDLAPEETYKSKGETDVDSLTSNSRDEFLSIDYGEEYYYLFTAGGEWLYSSCSEDGRLNKLVLADSSVASSDDADLLASALEKLKLAGLTVDEIRVLGLSQE